MKKSLPFTLAMLLVVTAVAGPVTPQTAATVATTFWRSTVPSKAGAALLDQSAAWDYDGIYLFVCPTGGFVMVAADNSARPILGYSPTGTIDPDRLPLQLQEWLQGYQQQIDWLREHQSAPHATIADEWAALQQGFSHKGDGAKGVAPLLTTRWNQQEPYNELCPTGTVTGCAATAQAQLMKYWNHPAFGTGSHTYVHPVYGTQQAHFGNTLYDWDHMPDIPTPYSPQVERTAVATLMYHTGVSLDMDYGTAANGGSAAMGLVGMSGYPSIDNSLKDYFGYSPDMQVVRKDFGYTDEEWRSLIIAELDLGRPVLYTGSAEQGGHGFVCDGYDDRQYLHFNFGWSGIGDGYFPVDSISPGVGGAGGNGSYTFNMANSALVGVEPVYQMRVGATRFQFDRNGGVDSVLFCINDTVDIPWSVSSNASWLTVQPAGFVRAGWVKFEAAECDASSERQATLTFTQGMQTLEVTVAQANLDPDEMCPLTVVMQAIHGDGWQGDAHLTLETGSGFILGTAQLESGALDSVQILVPGHDVYSVWHSGGGTDRYVNYYIRNPYGETLVEAEYAYLTGGTDLIVWPCNPVGLEPAANGSTVPSIYPNPTGDMLHIDADGLHLIEVLDLTGRTVLRTDRPSASLRRLPDGAYFVRITTAGNTCVRKVIKSSD